MAGYKAFRADYMGSDLLFSDDFTDFESRKLRYAVYWAMYENTVYDSLHKWAVTLKSTYGLYEYIRNIYSPAYRLGEFWKAHLLGGKLDPEAGDGEEKDSALPILTENQALRGPIAVTWRNSNWQIKKDILGLWGSVLGDAAIKIIDNPEKQKAYLSIVHPGTISSLEMDDWGNVKGYEIEETRSDPRNPIGRDVLYREVAYRRGDYVVYETYLNHELYDWDDDGVATWKIPYGFVPLIFIQHNDVGLDFGWSEMHANRSKFMEVDDLASKLSDHIRKEVDPPWLFAGVSKKSGSTTETTKEADTDNAPKKGRQQIPALYATDPQAKAQALVSDLDIEAASSHIMKILEKLEKEYPELNLNMDQMQGDWSARALRVNRGPAEEKVLQRRPNYDDALVRAQQMAIAIGGWRGYPGYEGFGLESYDKGALDHSIGDRPVFSKDELDELERETEFWAVAGAAKNAGVPLLVYLELKGWPPEKIAKIRNSPEYKSQLATMELTQKAAQGAFENPGSGGGNRFSNDKKPTGNNQEGRTKEK